MIQGYFDESTEYGETVTTVAGFLAEDVEWARITEKWNSRLRDDGLTWFHATDCANSDLPPKSVQVIL
jgi:hypothetical protein